MKLTAIGLILLALAGCNTAPPTVTEQQILEEQSETALSVMNRTDPTLDALLRRSHGYAIFPSVGKGGLIAGGAYGRGTAYEQGKFIGYVDLTQATIGGQIGGQTYSELVVLENQFAMDRFKSGKLTLETGVSAVALDRSTGQRAQFRDGVLVIIRPEGGLMAEAVIGGQQFTFVPAEAAHTVGSR